MEKFTFFWKNALSQWHQCRFTVKGVEYNCAEQFMMAEKARLFGDKEMEAKIMSAYHPRDQKAFGRRVKNFNPQIWNRVARDVVYTGNYARFTQNPYLKEMLLKTAGTTLVEASPYDNIWGIALEGNDPRAQQRETWRGKNWLGETLTKVREDILKEGDSWVKKS